MRILEYYEDNQPHIPEKTTEHMLSCLLEITYHSQKLQINQIGIYNIKAYTSFEGKKNFLKY